MSTPPPAPFSFLALPLSLRLTIYDLALSAALVPLTTLLLISREALEHVRRGVYDRVSVVSMRGLARFVSSQGAVRYGKNARSLSIRLGGGSTVAGISPVLGRMISLTPNVESINLVCYTLRVDPERHRLVAGLSTIDPISFSWSSPDPHHQFTIAIFAQHLAPVLSGYTRLQHLALSNVSFGVLEDPSRGESAAEVHPMEGADWAGQAAQRSTLSLPPHLIGRPMTPGGRRTGGSLRSLRIQKAVFLRPEVVLEWVADVEGASAARRRGDECGVAMGGEAFTALDDEEDEEEGLDVFLEDVYIESIWGPRLRMAHLVDATRKLGLSPACLSRVHVGGRYERIHGGDRLELDGRDQ